jgi:soluble lytic murein transglycosylase
VLWRGIKITFFFAVLIGLLGVSGYFYWEEHHVHENPYDPIITSVAHDEGVDPFLIRALIWRESRFIPSTHGSADERGLMQITPEAGQIWAKANKISNFTPDNLYDPETNIRAGTWYLNRAIHRWSQANADDPITFALAEYNAGRSNALRWVDPANPQDHNAFMQRITYASTRKYVEVILEQRAKYRADLSTNRWYRDYATANPTVSQTP